MRQVQIRLRHGLRSSCWLQVAFIFGIWALSEVTVRLTHMPLPGSTLGLFVLLALLLSGRLSIRAVRRGALCYLGEMLLFLIPALVGVLDHPEFLGWLGIKIFAAVILGTLAVMITTALVIETASRLTSPEKGTSSAAE